MEFSRSEHWSGELFLSPADFPDPGIEAGSLALQADSLSAELPGKWEDKPLVFQVLSLTSRTSNT